LEHLSIHFDINSYGTPNFDVTVDVSSLPDLAHLVLSAGGRSSLRKTIPLTFVQGESSSLTQAYICGAFEIQSSERLIDLVASFGPALETLSLARLRIVNDSWSVFGPPLGAMLDLPHLKGMELHDINPAHLSPLGLPSLEKLVIMYSCGMNFSRGIVPLLSNVGGNLRILSIASVGMDRTLQKVPLPFILQLLHCPRLERFHLYGTYLFDYRNWRMLCHKVFQNLDSLYICKPQAGPVPEKIKNAYVTDFIGNVGNGALQAVANGYAVIRTTELVQWQAVSDNQASEITKFKFLLQLQASADPDIDLPISSGLRPTGLHRRAR
jgi:hypothetical protein